MPGKACKSLARSSLEHGNRKSCATNCCRAVSSESQVESERQGCWSELDRSAGPESTNVTNPVQSPAGRWLVSTRPVGEVLTAEVSAEGVRVIVFGTPG